MVFVFIDLILVKFKYQYIKSPITIILLKPPDTKKKHPESLSTLYRL